jgi:hypothetical protein
MSGIAKTQEFALVAGAYEALQNGEYESRIDLRNMPIEALKAGVREAHYGLADSYIRGDMINVKRYERTSDAFLHEVGRRAMRPGPATGHPTVQTPHTPLYK